MNEDYVQIETLINAVTLTNAYADANSGSKDVNEISRAALLVNYTTGATETNNSIEVKIEFGPTDSELYRTSNKSDSSGTSTLTAQEFTFVGAAAATSYKFRIPLDLADKVIKVSVKETGVVTNAGTATVKLSAAGV